MEKTKGRNEKTSLEDWSERGLNIFRLCLRHVLVEPLHISEVLTMRQQFTLGIHPHGTLVGASLIGLEIETEGVQVALVLDKREWQYLVDGYVIGWIVVENHKL